MYQKKNNIPGFIAGRIKSMGFAVSGIKQVFRSETNFKIHSAAVVLTAVAGWYFHISANEWLAIIVCFGAVTTAEALNTSIEKLGNILAPDHYRAVGPVKDIAAGAVLLSSIAALLVGLIVFVPKIVVLCGFGAA